MANISDVIEKFIIETLGDDVFMDLSRNELAEFFNVAPSQINYVLSTRFNFERGFLTESRRGGGGYIRLSRLVNTKVDFLRDLIESVGDELEYRQALSILSGLVEFDKITSEEKEKLEWVMSPKSLATPLKIENSIRAKMMKNLLMNLGRGHYESM